MMSSVNQHGIKVSVIVPVYNVEKYLGECLDSICRQTLKEIEILCVDDQSTDRSVAILEEYAAKDARIKILHQANKGGGAARNHGFAHAKGEYCIFLDSDDIFDKRMLEQAYAMAVERSADIVVFDFERFSEDGTTTQITSIKRSPYRSSKDVFSYKDWPRSIMSLVNPVPWNKLYRTRFVADGGFKFEEISSTNDVTFATVTVAAAERIAYLQQYLVHYRVGHSNTVTSTKTKSLNNVSIAVSSAVDQVLALPHGKALTASVQRFAVEKFVFSLRNYVADFSSEQARAFYTYIHDYLNKPLFDSVSANTFEDESLCRIFHILKTNAYDELVERLGKKLIVSLTSFPARIKTVHLCISSMLRQTKRPDQIILWLSESQFPQHGAELPPPLLALVRQKNLVIRWCKEDLYPHKKYYYAFKEYPNDLIVTIDDDLQYHNHMLQNLWETYLGHPHAVIGVRTHLITLDEKGDFMPYEHWIQEVDGLLHEPSMQLIATTGAGTLHPAELFQNIQFDQDDIINTALYADDLWLKAIELIGGIPVVCCQRYQSLRYIPGTQDDSLYQINVRNGQNDIQMEKIIQWADARFGQDVLQKRIASSDYASVSSFDLGQLAFIKSLVANALNRGRSTASGGYNADFVPLPQKGPFKMLRKKFCTMINILLISGPAELKKALKNKKSAGK